MFEFVGFLLGKLACGIPVSYVHTVKTVPNTTTSYRERTSLEEISFYQDKMFLRFDKRS